MKCLLVDDKGFRKFISRKEFQPDIYIAVQQIIPIHSFLSADKNLEHFDKNNFKKIWFRFSGLKTKKGIYIYKQER